MLSLKIQTCLRKLNFRSLHIPGNSFVNLEQNSLLINLMQVRWKKIPSRKPRWMPMAKSKLFIIKPRLDVIGLENRTRITLTRNYLSYMKSLQDYFAAENERMDSSVVTEFDSKEFEDLLKVNQEENIRVAKMRETVLETELNLEAQVLVEKDEEHQKWLAVKKEEVETLVKYEKSQSATYVRLDNLESAIEYALNNPVNYNFAIGLSGQVHWEKQPRPDDSPYWLDDKPRQRLDRPPYRPYQVKREKKHDIVFPKGIWI